MILGLGTDLVAIKAMSTQLDDEASAFQSATFTAAEVGYSQGASSRAPQQHLAARFAAKEATIKALDTACRMAQLAWPRLSLRDIEVIVDEQGRPSLKLYGSAAALASALGADRTWLSLSHDGDYASAVVALERLS